MLGCFELVIKSYEGYYISSYNDFNLRRDDLSKITLDNEHKYEKLLILLKDLL